VAARKDLVALGVEVGWKPDIDVAFLLRRLDLDVRLLPLVAGGVRHPGREYECVGLLADLQAQVPRWRLSSLSMARLQAAGPRATVSPGRAEGPWPATSRWPPGPCQAHRSTVTCAATLQPSW
jgi:hypothetical protein